MYALYVHLLRAPPYNACIWLHSITLKLWRTLNCYYKLLYLENVLVWGEFKILTFSNSEDHIRERLEGPAGNYILGGGGGEGGREGGG